MAGKFDTDIGSDYPGPHFPRYGEPWGECFICAADYPVSKLVRHYKFKRLVCVHCDDQKTQSDFLEEMTLPLEETHTSEQPVSCQGKAGEDYWYSGLWYEMEWYGHDECDIDNEE